MARTPHTRQVLSTASLTKHYDGFLKSLRSKRPETRGTYARALHEFLRWHRQDGGCRMLPTDIERYKRHLASVKRLSTVSVSTYLTAVRRFCEYLVGNGVIGDNPARHIGGNSRPRVHSRASLTQEEVHTLLTSVSRTDERGLRDFAFINLMLGCALSEIEIVRANIGDRVELNGINSLRVQGKGRIRKDETVTLPPDAASALDAYLAARPGLAPDDPLFASAGNRTRGKRMTTRGVRDRVTMHLWSAGVRSAGGRNVTPYSLRHTAAVFMAGSGASADEIRQKMRLGTLATAMLYINQSKAAGS